MWTKKASDNFQHKLATTYREEYQEIVEEAKLRLFNKLSLKNISYIDFEAFQNVRVTNEDIINFFHAKGIDIKSLYIRNKKWYDEIFPSAHRTLMLQVLEAFRIYVEQKGLLPKTEAYYYYENHYLNGDKKLTSEQYTRWKQLKAICEKNSSHLWAYSPDDNHRFCVNCMTKQRRGSWDKDKWVYSVWAVVRPVNYELRTWKIKS